MVLAEGDPQRWNRNPGDFSAEPIYARRNAVESQQRAEIIGKAIVDAWNHIVETPDELLVDLIAETAERIGGFKPEPELVEQFWYCSTRYPVSGIVESNRAQPYPEWPQCCRKVAGQDLEIQSRSSFPEDFGVSNRLVDCQTTSSPSSPV